MAADFDELMDRAQDALERAASYYRDAEAIAFEVVTHSVGESL